MSYPSNLVIPSLIEQTSPGGRFFDIYSRLLNGPIHFLGLRKRSLELLNGGSGPCCTTHAGSIGCDIEVQNGPVKATGLVATFPVLGTKLTARAAL